MRMGGDPVPLDIEPESEDERHAREARTKQNALVPIARLPPELLAAIFMHCVPVSTRKLHSDLSWLNVTRVSDHWRSVALGCPALWSTIICSRPTLVPMMLARAKQAPLVICVDLGKHLVYSSPMVIILDCASRLGVLDVRSPQFYLTAFLSNLHRAAAMPRLQELKIVNTDDDNLGEGGMWLPTDLFRRKEVLAGRKPGVRVGLGVHLESCAFPWDSPWYVDLTHLHLENINQTQCPTMEALLAILVGTPRLQTLSLIYSTPTTLEGFSVALPHLSTLTLKSNAPSRCARLLGYLIIPPSAIVKVSAACDGTAEHEHNMHLTLIPKFFASPCTYDTVRIVHEGTPTFLLLDSARPHWSRRLRIYAGGWAPEAVFKLTKAVIARLDAGRVTTLHLHGTPGGCREPRDVAARADFWDLLGTRLAGVRTLHLHRGVPTAWLEFHLTHAAWLLGVSSWKSCVYGFYPRLRNASAGAGVDGARGHLWPALRRLHLHAVDLGARAGKGPPRAADGPYPSRADMLRALLWARREGGARLCTLELEGCTNVFALDLRYLRLFADVVHDGAGLSAGSKADAGVSLRDYSLNVFSNVIEHSVSLCL